MTYTKEQIEKLQVVDDAFRGIVGIPIPYHLIVQHFTPLQKWLNHTIRGNEDDFGAE